MVRKLILGAASVLALGIGGAALEFSAGADNLPKAAPQATHHWLNAAQLSKDDIRWAQVELRMIGLYNGSLDGVAGPETKRALLGFQTRNGLERTATLDQQTGDALIGHSDSGMRVEGRALGPQTSIPRWLARVDDETNDDGEFERDGSKVQYQLDEAWNSLRPPRGHRKDEQPAGQPPRACGPHGTKLISWRWWFMVSTSLHTTMTIILLVGIIIGCGLMLASPIATKL